MASIDYKLCDLCGFKAFYDANIEDQRYRASWGAKDSVDVAPIGIAVLCPNCNATHECVIRKRRKPR